MNEIMNWAAHYNTLIIQVAFTVVLVLIVIYVYRLFFVSSMSSSPGSDSGTDLTEVNEKLNQLLRQGPGSSPTAGLEKATGTSSSAGPAASASMAAGTPASASSLQEELDKLKAENAQLKMQLNESEKKVFELTPVGTPEEQAQKAAQVTAAAPSSASGSAAAAVADSAAEIAGLNKKIEELQSRLSEYDIIADDIAELSQLRSENAELKKRLSGSSGFEGLLAAVPQTDAAVEAPPQPVATEPVAALPELDLPDVKIEPQPAAPQPAAPEPAAPEPAAPEPAAPVVAEAAAEAEIPVVAQTDVTVDQTVPEAEKSLMSDFEKSTQKG